MRKHFLTHLIGLKERNKKRKNKIDIFLAISCRNVFYLSVFMLLFSKKCFKTKKQWLEIPWPGNALQALFMPLVSKFSHTGRELQTLQVCLVSWSWWTSQVNLHKDLYDWKYIDVVFPFVFPPHGKIQNSWNFSLLRPEILFQCICHLAMQGKLLKGWK